MARNSNVFSFCAELHELIYIFMSVSTVTSCSLSSVCWALLSLFLFFFFLKLLTSYILQSVLWWDWLLLLPEHLVNSVKFSICLAYSSSFLLVILSIL